MIIMSLWCHEADIEEIPYIAWVSTPTPLEFAGGVRMDAEVDQCDQRGHIGVNYQVLVWDSRKRFETTSAKHSFHPAYPTHAGIGFLGIWTRWVQHGGGKGYYPRV